MNGTTDQRGDAGERLSAMDATLELQRQSWEKAGEFVETLAVAPERIHQAANVDVGETPSEVVYSEHKLDLLHYQPLTDEQHDVPILIVYALINRPYILDLQPNRSVVRRLLEAGFDVYLIDWGEPSTLDTTLSLHDYVERFIGNCVDVVRERSGVEDINVLGYCMGGTMSAMYAALYPEKVRTLGLMAAGLCFDGTGGTLEQWGGEQYDAETLVETFGNVPGDLLSVGFAMMDPVQNFLTKYLRLFDYLDDQAFVENFVRMERWVRDSPDVAGEAYREFIEYFYRENRLMRNEVYLGDRHVDVGELDMPILQLVAENDHLVPPAASVPFNDVVPSDDVTVIESPTGHIGLSVSSKAHAEVWPDVCEWFEERSELGEPAEVAETAEPEAEGEPEADVAVEAEPGEPARSERETAAETGPEPSDLREVSGIGPAYEERLREAGIATVEALAGADPETLAPQADIPENRLEELVERARDRVSEE